MPVKSCRIHGRKMWKIGSGPCIYTTKAKAERAYARRTPKKTMVRRFRKKMGKTAAEKVASGMKKWAKK